MADFALVQDDTVVNVIVAEDAATAAALTGLEVVEIADGAPGIGWTLESDGWRAPSPFPSWVWEGSRWIAPIAYPEDGAYYVWDEAAGDWVEVVVDPEPAPEE